MPYFKDAEDVYANLGLFMRQLSVDPEMTPALKRADTTFQLRLRNPDSVMTVRTPRDDEPPQVDLGDTTLQPEVVLQLDADTAHRFWLGQLNVAVALANGDIRTRGPVAKVLKLVPLVKPGFPRYRQQLEASGREDLLQPGRDPGLAGRGVGLDALTRGGDELAERLDVVRAGQRDRAAREEERHARDPHARGERLLGGDLVVALARHRSRGTARSRRARGPRRRRARRPARDLRRRRPRRSGRGTAHRARRSRAVVGGDLRRAGARAACSARASSGRSAVRGRTARPRR